MSDMTTSIELIEDEALDAANGGLIGLLLPAVQKVRSDTDYGLLLPAVKTAATQTSIG